MLICINHTSRQGICCSISGTFFILNLEVQIHELKQGLLLELSSSPLLSQKQQATMVYSDEEFLSLQIWPPLVNN